MIYNSPIKLLKKYGIIKPEQINIEALAYSCGAIVRYTNLNGYIRISQMLNSYISL